MLKSIRAWLMSPVVRELRAIKERIHMDKQQLLDRVNALGEALGAVSDQLTKSNGELTTELANLKDAVANAGGSTPEVDAAFDLVEKRVASMKDTSQALDDLVRDAPEADGTPPPAG